MLTTSSCLEKVHFYVSFPAVAPKGVQAYLAILGSTFASTLVLLEGYESNDGQTPHHDTDAPIPLEAIWSLARESA